MAPTYVTEGGDGLAINPTDVSMIKALEIATARTTDDLLSEAVADLRIKLVPSTKPAPPPKQPRKNRQPQPAQPQEKS